MSELLDISRYSDKSLLKEMGNCVQQIRIQSDVTQNQLAKDAAVSRSTVSAFEQGENISLLNLIKILRTLDALYLLKDFKVLDQISPLKLAEGKPIRRQRASVVTYSNKTPDDTSW